MADHFWGTFTSSVNKEKWITLPAQIKKKFSPADKQTVIVTIGPKKNVAVFPLTNWKDYMASLKSRGEKGDQRARELIYTLRHYASEEKVEPNGRVKIPENLISIAKISKKVTVKGDGNYVAVWNPEQFSIFDNEILEKHTTMFNPMDYEL